MKRVALLSVAVLLFWTACVDEPEGARAPLMGPSASVTQAPTGATVCVAYGRELENADREELSTRQRALLLNNVGVLYLNDRRLEEAERFLTRSRASSSSGAS